MTKNYAINFYVGWSTMESNGKVLLFFKCTKSDKTKNIFFPLSQFFFSAFLDHVSIATVRCLCVSCCIKSIEELRHLKYRSRTEKVLYFHFTISEKRSRVFYCEIKVEINIFLRFLRVSRCEKCFTTATTFLIFKRM